MALSDEIEGNLLHAPLVLAKFYVFIYTITNLRLNFTVTDLGQAAGGHTQVRRVWKDYSVRSGFPQTPTNLVSGNRILQSFGGKSDSQKI